MPTKNPTYEEALDYMRKYEKILSDMSECPRGSDAWLKLDMEIREAVPYGIYKHFKSSREKEMHYSVLGISNSTENEKEYTVQYVALYPPHDGRLTGRPLFGENGFLTPVKRKLQSGKMYEGPRFVFLRKRTPDEAMALIF